MEEILVTRPRWLARYGTVLLAVVLVVLVILASWFTYPDTVTGDLTLTTVDPPRVLLAPQDFTIEEILVGSGDTVEAMQTLLVARSSATFADVASLDTKLYNARDESDAGLAAFVIPTEWNLGEIQETVFDFREKQSAYVNLRERRLDGLTTRELTRRITDRETFIRRERRRQGPLEDAAQRARTRVQRLQQRASEGIRNTEALNDQRIILQRAEDALQQSRGEVRAAAFDIELMRNQVESYRGGLPSTLTQAADELRASYDALRAAVSGWMRNHALTAPIRGSVILERGLRPESFVLRGTEIATLLPANAGNVIGRLELPVRGSGKVDIGQRVLVRFDSYPYLEYGSVEGTVTARATFERDRRLMIEVAFREPLYTTTGHRLDATPFMRGQASVVTGERSLLERFMDRF